MPRRHAEEQQHAGLAGHPADLAEIDDFSVGRANSSRDGACQPVNRRDPGKHRLFRNPDRPGVEFIAHLAAALEDERESASSSPSDCRVACASGSGR